MSKLNAKFVVAIQPVEFQFDDADQAVRFQRAMARLSAKTHRRLTKQSAATGQFPCIGSFLNAYPLDEDGNAIEQGITLGTQGSTLEFTSKSAKADRAEKPKRTPRKGRKAADAMESMDEDDAEVEIEDIDED